ncbi:MAG: diguanylate cyclase [Bradymonadales bacterium]|nr:diguanylate cyclase [Bradymonadales bacterium]
MSTGAARNHRAERAGRRVRPGLPLELLLFVTAILLFLGGGPGQVGPTLPGVIALSLLTVAMIRRGVARPAAIRSHNLADLFGGLAILLAAFILIRQLESLAVDLYPALYALLALFVTVYQPWIALGLAAFAIGLELTLGALSLAHPLGVDLNETCRHVTWMALFTAANLAASWVSRWRRAPRLAASRQESQTGPPHPLDPQPSEPLQVDGQDLINAAAALVRKSCAADSVVLLQISPDRKQLVVTASTLPEHLETTLDAQAGFAGSVLRTGQALMANHLRRDYPGSLPGETGEVGSHVMASLVRYGQKNLGVLVARRNGGPPFIPDDLTALEIGSSLVGSALAAERAVERVTEAHYELERFFAASRLLNSALTPEQVYQSATQALHMITDFELLAITWIDQPEGAHRVVHASGELAAGLEGKAVETERSLCAMVVKNGHYLPLGCDYRPGPYSVLVAQERLETIRSLLVMPLRLHDRVQGTLTIGSTAQQVFKDDRRGMAEVIANQVAVSLDKAKIYARVQEMATIDALTHLHNRRAFQERFGEAQARALRSKTPLSLVLLDIDHFKAINDTHGHPTGDKVLASLGETISGLLRRTDVAARHGGEEFALILEGTDPQGALVMAERLRRVVGEIRFTSAAGIGFGITLSLGVATYPQHALDPQVLFNLADQALYEAKRSGRNQTRLARAIWPRKDRTERMKLEGSAEAGL